MNKNYWEKYYKDNGEHSPTDFAEFCNKTIKPRLRIIELGSGNGRDAYFLGEQGHKVIAVDYTTKPVDTKNVKFVKQDAVDFLKHYKEPYDVIYSRFFLHAITKVELKKILSLSSGIFLAEARSIKDTSFKKDHKRNLIDGNELFFTLTKMNFHTILFREGNDMARYKGQNPIIIRIMAIK